MGKYMNFKEHRKDFNKRWNITSSETSEEAFYKFKQRILNAFRQIENQLTRESVTKFCQYYAIEEKWKSISSTRLSKNIINQLEKENTLIEIYRAIEIILSLKFQSYTDHNSYRELNYRSKIIENVKEAIEISDVDVAIVKSHNSITLYPKGEKKLDEELVNKTLSFLNKKSNKHFEEALKFYQSKKTVKSAESLRRSLEEFLRYKLENRKGLSENIKILQKNLKENNSTSETRNIIFTVFNQLDKHFNEHSKHGDSVNEPENEFLIYQTGLLMRYINQIGKFEK